MRKIVSADINISSLHIELGPKEAYFCFSVPVLLVHHIKLSVSTVQ